MKHKALFMSSIVIILLLINKLIETQNHLDATRFMYVEVTISETLGELLILKLVRSNKIALLQHATEVSLPYSIERIYNSEAKMTKSQVYMSIKIMKRYKSFYEGHNSLFYSKNINSSETHKKNDTMLYLTNKIDTALLLADKYIKFHSRQ